MVNVLVALNVTITIISTGSNHLGSVAIDVLSRHEVKAAIILRTINDCPRNALSLIS